VLRRYSDAWFQAAKRRRAGQRDAGFPRRKRALVPVRCYHGTFTIQGQRVRLPVAKGEPELWVRLARPLPYPDADVRAVTLLAEGGRLWLAVTAAIPIQHPDLDPARVAGVDLGIIHPYAVVAETAGCWCRAGAPGGKLPASCRSAGPPSQGRPAGTHARAARVAPLAAPSGSPAAGRSAPSPPRPSGPPSGRQAGHRLRAPAAGGQVAGGRPDGDR
jgi:hypothetical protein